MPMEEGEHTGSLRLHPPFLSALHTETLER